MERDTIRAQRTVLWRIARDGIDHPIHLLEYESKTCDEHLINSLPFDTQTSRLPLVMRTRLGHTQSQQHSADQVPGCWVKRYRLIEKHKFLRGLTIRIWWSRDGFWWGRIGFRSPLGSSNISRQGSFLIGIQRTGTDDSASVTYGGELMGKENVMIKRALTEVK